MGLQRRPVWPGCVVRVGMPMNRPPDKIVIQYSKRRTAVCTHHAHAQLFTGSDSHG